VLAAMTYLHADVYRHYYQRWRVLRFCSEWKEVVPRRFDDREHCAFLYRTLKGEEKDWTNQLE